jgi:hypothetical protein
LQETRLTVGKQIQARARATRVTRARCLEFVSLLRALVVSNNKSVANRVQEATDKISQALHGATKIGEQTSKLGLGFSSGFTLELLP